MTVTRSDVLASPTNLDFESGADSAGLPFGWTARVQRGFTVALDADDPHSGGFSCRIHASGRVSQSSFQPVRQKLSAAPFRGGVVRLTAWLRTRDVRAWAGLYVRADTAQGDIVGLVTMAGRGARGDTPWTSHQIDLEVPAIADIVVVGMMLTGGGSVWIDDVSVERLDPATSWEPPRELTTRGLDNLVVFARLLGYVRHFHPSDEAASADWDRVAIAGVRDVEDADDLADSLRRVLGPLAPAMQVATRRPRDRLDSAPPDSAEVVGWRHDGLGGLSGSSIYSSARITQDLARQDGLALPAPESPYVEELAHGVWCSVPLTVYRDEDGTLPRSDRRMAAPSASTHVPSGNDRATRLAGVVLAWNVFQHFYPYFDVVDADWPAELRAALVAAATDADARSFAGTLRRLVAALRDGHGSVIEPQPPLSAALPLAWDWIEGRLVVTHAGARARGIRRGDVVREIDGVAAEDRIRTCEETVSAATRSLRRSGALRELRRGTPEKEVTLSLERDGRGVRNVVLARDTRPLRPRARPPKIAQLGGGVVYADLTRLSDRAFDRAVPTLAEARGIVYDMRGYPRLSPVFIAHIISTPVTSPQWHVPLVLRPNREDLTFRLSNWTVEPSSPRFTERVAFLTDDGAISYAETCMGIVEHYRLAEIVGSATAGTNGNVNPFTIPGGYQIWWTGMKVLKHDGSRHHGVGILPTIPVTASIDGARAGRDEVLEAGVRAVRGV